MASDRFLRAMNALHGAVIAASGGRLGLRVGTMPTVRLTTTGRRSGASRTVLLASPLVEGDAVVLVASRGGDDRHPDWYRNAIAHPAVEVQVAGGASVPMVAREAEGAERDALWKRLVAAEPRYARYQAKTTRVIPVLVLEPASAG